MSSLSLKAKIYKKRPNLHAQNLNDQRSIDLRELSRNQSIFLHCVFHDTIGQSNNSLPTLGFFYAGNERGFPFELLNCSIIGGKKQIMHLSLAFPGDDPRDTPGDLF